MSNIKWLEKAWYDFCDIDDKNIKKRIIQLIKDINRDPYHGIGKPEHLVNSNSFSRRIDEKNRLVYSIDKNDIVIHSCINHYNDK